MPGVAWYFYVAVPPQKSLPPCNPAFPRSLLLYYVQPATSAAVCWGPYHAYCETTGGSTGEVIRTADITGCIQQIKCLRSVAFRYMGRKRERKRKKKTKKPDSPFLLIHSPTFLHSTVYRGGDANVVYHDVLFQRRRSTYSYAQ